MNNVRFIIDEVKERGISVMRVFGDLDFEHRKDFAHHIDKLLSSENKKIVIDLTETARIFSIYIGTLVDVNQQAISQDKSLTILVSKKQKEFFEKLDMNSLLNIIQAK